MDPTDDPFAFLAKMSDEDLFQMLFPYENEQNVLSQEMGLGQQLRQRGPERSSPLGAALGGFSNALGNAGGAFMQRGALDKQRALGELMRKDAKTRLGAMQPAGSKGMLPTMSEEDVDALFAGGMP